jgi:predicted transcriptional regulator of viral defense system
MYPKTLGSKNARLLTTLAGRGKTIFSVEDAQQIAGGSYHATLELMRRLVKAGWVVRLGAGKYAVVSLAAGNEAIPEANRLVIARELADNAPYYISHDSALEVHNMLTRPVTTVTITTTRRMLGRKILNVPYRFVTAKPENMWGYSPVWIMPSEQVQVSDLERTILDGLARPDLCAGISEVAIGLWMRKENLNWEKLVDYAGRLRNQAAVKRLGYLLEIYELGTEKTISALQELVGPSYALLDPMLSSQGHYLARWRLHLNIDPDVLKGIGTT